MERSKGSVEDIGLRSGGLWMCLRQRSFLELLIGSHNSSSEQVLMFPNWNGQCSNGFIWDI